MPLSGIKGVPRAIFPQGWAKWKCIWNWILQCFLTMFTYLVRILHVKEAQCKTVVGVTAAKKNASWLFE